MITTKDTALGRRIDISAGNYFTWNAILDIQGCGKAVPQDQITASAGRAYGRHYRKALCNRQPTAQSS